MAKTAMTGASTRSSTSEEEHRETEEIVPLKNDRAESQPYAIDNLSQALNLQLTVHKLNGKNYLEWAQSVKLTMEGRSRLGYLTGEIKQPEKDDSTWKKWKAENSLIMSWMINSMEPSIGKPYLFLSTAQDVWEAVKDCYSDLENSSQIYDLKTRLWQSKQGGQDVTTYYNLLLTLWQELDQCYEEDWENPKDAARFKKREENDRVYMFLAGLDRSLDEVRGRILARRPLPSIREVFSEVRREEARKG